MIVASLSAAVMKTQCVQSMMPKSVNRCSDEHHAQPVGIDHVQAL
jgi:hypothetical protein